MLLADSGFAVGENSWYIGQLVVIIGLITIASIVDGIDNELLCNTVIVVEAIQHLCIVLRIVVLQLGQTELNEIPNSAVKGTDIVEVGAVASDMLSVSLPRAFGRADSAVYLVEKVVALLFVN